MNIAVNCRLLQQGRLEGIGWFMYENLKRIARDHPEHQFFFIFDRPFDPSFIFSDNIKALVLGPPTRHPFLWYLWFEWRLPGVLEKINADLLFSPDGYLSLRCKIPQVPVIHDINFAHRPKDLPFLTRHYYNYYFPRFARKADRICTVSEYSQKDISKTYAIDESMIHVVYNGANEAYKPLDGKEKQAGRMKYANGSEYFIFIGSIHPRKNLGNLIEAYEKFVERTGSEVKLVVVGAQMWQGQQTAKALRPRSMTAIPDPERSRRVEGSNILFLGRLEAEELREALGSALAMTFVPWFEGFGIPVVEAMYAGVPVLTSTETSLPEVGGEAVLYAHPGNVQEISDQMEKLASDASLREGLIQKGKQQKEKFSWDQTSHKVWDCLETVIAGIENNHD
ncbi:MAG: glycosyltransferase family 1 protein [Bacteroidota bacterium]|nr:glycosyltransferase family 1 protein [Bacteroidota bacterium]